MCECVLKNGFDPNQLHLIVWEYECVSPELVILISLRAPSRVVCFPFSAQHDCSELYRPVVMYISVKKDSYYSKLSISCLSSLCKSHQFGTFGQGTFTWPFLLPLECGLNDLNIYFESFCRRRCTIFQKVYISIWSDSKRETKKQV